ncbi:hypothetical protein TEK04_20020 [Klenkia sp. LSe6-5]|uniref:Peptide/nickel transport system substrate-binding protein n=1 Tax=Klenkia sesuvii TaxID=3103137 RepID=A0ABU8DYW0_9ACTN
MRGINGTPAFMVQTNQDLRVSGGHRQTTTPEYEQLVQQLVEATGDDADDAVEAYTDYLNEQAVVVPLVTSTGVAVRSTQVQGIDGQLLGTPATGACFVE